MEFVQVSGNSPTESLVVFGALMTVVVITMTIVIAFAMPVMITFTMPVMVGTAPYPDTLTLRAAAAVTTIVRQTVSSGTVVGNPRAAPRTEPERLAPALVFASIEFLGASDDGGGRDEER